MNKQKKYKKINYYRYLNTVIVLSLCTSIEANAADWTPIKKNKAYELLVDMDSYNESEGLPFITAKTVFNGSKNFELNGKKGSYIEEHSTSQFNCKLHTYKVLETHFYKPKNKLVGNQKGFKLFKPLENGSDNASIASLVCQVHKMVGGQ
jgi:hypothetical protein